MKKVKWFINNCLQAIGDKLYDKDSSIWKKYPEGRMTFSRACRILLSKEKQPEKMNPSGEAYPKEDYKSIGLQMFNNERAKNRKRNK